MFPTQLRPGPAPPRVVHAGGRVIFNAASPRRNGCARRSSRALPGAGIVKRDLYSKVSARIVAELQRGAAPWVKPWSATAGNNVPCNAMTNRPYSGCNVLLLWMAQQAGYRAPRYLTFKQGLEVGGNVRRGEHGTKVYFVKQLQIRDERAEDEDAVRLVPMLREYTVFNIDQCENLPEAVSANPAARVRNPDRRDQLADAFLRRTNPGL